MQWTERSIGRFLVRQFFKSKYLAVIPNCCQTGHEADLLCITENRRMIDVEIKISRSDLKADRKKDKWIRTVMYGNWNHKTQQMEERVTAVRDWPPKVWKHYYAMPAEIWSDDLLEFLPSKNSGILLLSVDANHRVSVGCKRRSKTNPLAEKLSENAILNLARLASLRMWDAYQSLEAAQQTSSYYREKLNTELCVNESKAG